GISSAVTPGASSMPCGGVASCASAPARPPPIMARPMSTTMNHPSLGFRYIGPLPFLRCAHVDAARQFEAVRAAHKPGQRHPRDRRGALAAPTCRFATEDGASPIALVDLDLLVHDLLDQRLRQTAQHVRDRGVE